MSTDVRFERMLAKWPRLDALRSAEREWLVDAVKRISTAGAEGLVHRIMPESCDQPARDSNKNQFRLLDFLAEVRTAMDLLQHRFKLLYEAQGQDKKTVDFLATTQGMSLYIEVKRFNPSEKFSQFWESKSKSLVTWEKDDVRIGRHVRNGAEKMPDNNTLKVVLLFVENLPEYTVDVESYLFGRSYATGYFDTTGKFFQIPRGRDQSGQWRAEDNCSLTGVILAAPAAGWKFCGPITKVLFANPAREQEAEAVAQRWPMPIKRCNDLPE